MSSPGLFSFYDEALMKPLFFLFLFLLSSFSAFSADYQFAWEQTDTSLALRNHGKVVWQFNEGDKNSKPFFHPVSLVDGTILTEPRPNDHPWHLALWFSWKYLNGRNYWEEDPKTHQADGVTELLDVDYETKPDFSATITMNLAYHPRNEPALLHEKRVVQIHRPDEQGRYYFDWSSEFKAGEKPVQFDRTPILGEKNGVEYGGYAGLSIRFANEIKNPIITDSDGRQSMNIGKHRLSKQATWMRYAFTLPDGRDASICIFDNKNNPRHPTPWYTIVNPEIPFYYYSPAFLHKEPFALQANGSFALRYRIWVLGENGSEQDMQRKFVEYNP
jgi:hypothetical protein